MAPSKTSTGSSTLTVNQRNAATTFSGTFADTTVGGTTLTLVKTGAALLLLSGVDSRLTTSNRTTISAGVLQYAKPSSFMGGTSATWTTANFTVSSGAALGFNVGGAGEFATTDLDYLATVADGSNGFKSGSFLGIDPTNAGGATFTYGSNIVNPSGGAVVLGLMKLGSTATTPALVLNGNSTFTGGVSVAAGQLNIVNTSGLGAANSPLFLGGGTIDNTSGGTLVVANPETWNGAFTFVGTNALDLGNATVTLAGASTATINASTITIGGTLTGANTLTKAVSGGLLVTGTVRIAAMNANAGNIQLNAPSTLSGILTVGGAAVTLNSANTMASTTLTSGTLNANVASALSGPISESGGLLNMSAAGAIGSGILTISGGTIDNTSGAAFTLTNNQTWGGSFAFGGSNGLTFATGTLTMTGSRTLTTSGANALTISAGIGQSSAGFSFTKAGTGTLLMNAATGANAYTGGTTITGGILRTGANNELPTTGVLNVGANTNTNAAAIVDLQAFNQTVTAISTVSDYTAAGGTVSMSGILTVNGDVLFGANQTTATTSKATFVGNNTGVLNVTGTTFQVGAGTTANIDGCTVDMSTLATLNATLSTIFRVGDINSSGGAAATTTLILPGISNTITTPTLDVGADAGDAGNATLRLGAGTNAINANNIWIGAGQPTVATVRGNGVLNFFTSTGSVTMRAQDGSSRVTSLNMVNNNSSTPTANNLTSTIDLTGHTADISVTNLIMSRRSTNSTGGSPAAPLRPYVFRRHARRHQRDDVGSSVESSFDDRRDERIDPGLLNGGTVVIGTLTMAQNNTSLAVTGTNAATANLNVGGSTVTISNLSMGGAATQTTNSTTSTISVSAGSLTITNYTAAASALASAPLASVINVSGTGTLQFAGDIVNSSVTGATTTVSMGGGILDMQGHRIGTSAAAPGLVTLTANLGTLQNLSVN